MTIDYDDWKLTAYALGELDELDRAAIESKVATSPELRAYIEEIRATASAVTNELKGAASVSLTDAQRRMIQERASSNGERVAATVGAAPRGRNTWWVPTSIAAGIAMVLGVWHITAPSLSRARNEQVVTAGNDHDSAPAGLRRPSGSDVRNLIPFKDSATTLSGTSPAGPPHEARAGDSKEHGKTSFGYQVSQRGARKKRMAPAPGPGLVTVPAQILQARKTSDDVGSGGQSVFGGGGGQSVFGGKRSVARLSSRGRAEESELRDEARRQLASLGYLSGSSFALKGRFSRSLEAEGAELTRLINLDLYRAVGEGPSTESYHAIRENPFLLVGQAPLSTFSIDVDTASYANVRRFLSGNRMPPIDAVRIEELINYFDYDYPQPDGADPFSVSVEIASCPWNVDHRLARIGIKGIEYTPEERPAANLVFLVDVSGSMASPNKLPLLQDALRLMVDELSRDDWVSMVVYAGASGLALPSTSCENLDTIRTAIGNLRSGGSTNGGAGIQLAYDVALDNFIEGGINRVILATDGDFNVGTTGQGDLTRLIEEKAKSGVFLSVLGFGMGNLKDSTLEMLADQGNGNYAYIDTINEARKVLVDQLSGTLITIAKDVKIQVEFNPAQASAYRLIGYENRMLAARDFNDDTKDAGEIGAGHSVTALYEIVPPGLEVSLPDVDPLKYQTVTVMTPDAQSGELMTVKVRFKDPDGDVSKLIELPIADEGADYSESSDDFAFAAAVASFGMLLRESSYAGEITYDDVIAIAEEALGEDVFGYRTEFVELVRHAATLTAEGS